MTYRPHGPSSTNPIGPKRGADGGRTFRQLVGFAFR
jgi:hypothetical protein